MPHQWSHRRGRSLYYHTLETVLRILLYLLMYPEPRTPLRQQAESSTNAPLVPLVVRQFKHSWLHCFGCERWSHFPKYLVFNFSIKYFTSLYSLIRGHSRSQPVTSGFSLLNSYLGSKVPTLFSMWQHPSAS